MPPTITAGACSAAEIKSAGSYESMVASQDLTVGTGNGKITVTMEAITSAKGPSRSAPVEDDKSEPESNEEPETPETQEKVEEPKSEDKSEPESEPEVDTKVEQSSEQPAEQPKEEPESEPETK